MESSNRKLGIISLLILTIGLLVLYIISKDSYCTPKVDEDPYTYKTDSIQKDKYVKLLLEHEKLKKIKTPPKTVIKWKTRDIPIEGIKIEMGNVIINPNNNPIIYNHNFLTNYPKADKLIEFKLKKDSLNITTINTQGITTTKNYPLYFKQFKYHWFDNELHHEKVSNKDNKDPMKWNGLYINGGYSLLEKEPTLGLEYNITPGRFKVDLNTDFTITQNPQLNINAKIGYRLFN